MSEKLTIANIEETAESDYAVNIIVSDHQLKGDESIESGGKNLGPLPYDFLTAALGECTCMTVRWYALRQNWPLQKVMVRITHRKDNKTDIFTKNTTIIGDALTHEQREKLIEVAAKCPVQRTLEATPLIETFLL